MAATPSIIRSLSNDLLPMSWVPPPGTHDPHQLRPSAVLVLLFPCEGELRFLLIERPKGMTLHPGQIALPGGRVEVGDASLWSAALRETHEELGIPPHEISPLGRLEDTPVVASGHMIHPFVGWMDEVPTLRPRAAEVENVIDTPLSSLCDPTLIHEEIWQFRGADWIVTLYRFGSVVVWGATARVLSNLATRLCDPSGRDFPPGSVRRAAP